MTYLCAEEGIERGIEGTLAGKRAVRSAALDPASDVEELAAPWFTIFLRELQQVMERVGEPVKKAEIGPEPSVEAPVVVAAPAEIPSPVPAPAAAVAAVEPCCGGASRRGCGGAPAARVANRLRLARVVLDAGFPADAVRAAYDALAAAVARLLGDGVPRSHAALVAAIYRELLPSGRLAAAAPAALARLHDLTSLEAEGVEVDQTLASEAVAEAESWVARLVS